VDDINIDPVSINEQVTRVMTMVIELKHEIDGGMMKLPKM